VIFEIACCLSCFKHAIPSDLKNKVQVEDTSLFKDLFTSNVFSENLCKEEVFFLNLGYSWPIFGLFSSNLVQLLNDLVASQNQTWLVEAEI